jgi:hypothetical protein
MNTLNFPDANVWLALLWEQHIHSVAARAWFDGCEDEKFFFCRFTQLTVLRLLTTGPVMGSAVQTMAQSWRLWDKVVADDRMQFLPEPNLLETALRRQSRLPSASPKVWADAYLLAFASVAGLKLVTFDRALKSRISDVLILPK